MSTEDTIERIAQLLAQSRRVLFVTGAGISADSGLPTYRGVAGLYEGKETEDGLPIEAALSGDVFARRPDITWKYLAQIERNCRGAKPNAAHRTIAELEARLPYVLVFTQNVDGLHRRVGSRNLIGSAREPARTPLHRMHVHDLGGAPEGLEHSAVLHGVQERAATGCRAVRRSASGTRD